MPVYYGSYEVRPCESVDLTREDRTTEDGRYLGSVTRASLHGAIVPDCVDGVDEYVPTESLLSSILVAQVAIRKAFSTPGLLLEITGWDGTTTLSIPARTVSVTFEPGNWLSLCQFEIVMEGLEFSGEGTNDQFIESCSETWTFEQIENPRVSKATHQVRAKGVTLYNGTGGITAPAWDVAKLFVQQKLGLGWTAVGSAYFSPSSGQAIAATSNSDPASTLAWNYLVVDSIDELGGSYEATETWVLNPSSSWSEQSISVKTSSDAQGFTTSVTISGVVHGLYTGQNNFDQRNTNAQAGLTAIQATLQQTAVGYTPLTTLNPHPVDFAINADTTQGTISYSYEMNDRLLTGDTWELSQFAERATTEDYRITVDVSGTIYGAFYPGVDTDPLIKLTRAQARWIQVAPLLYARAVINSGLGQLKVPPLSAEVTEDQAAGTVSYHYTFDTRLFTTVEEEFTVSRKSTLESAITTVTVEGTIKGLRTTPALQAPQNPFEACDNAQAYFASIESSLLSRAALYLQTSDVNPVPWTSSLAVNEYAGSVGYSYEFTTKRQCYSFALSESISVTDEDLIPVIAIIPVIGRPGGPVIQSMSTFKERRRSLSIELIVPIPTSPCGYIPAPVIDITPWTPSANAVYIENNQVNYSPTDGRLSCNVVWVYAN
jgi:hypothetical protein